MKVGYSAQGKYRSMGRELPVSPKISRELAAAIRGMELEKAKAYLEKVAEEKAAVPYRRFNRKIGHKRKMAAGRYPVKASKMFLKVLENAEANAEGENLIIQHISANRGRVQYGGYKGRSANTLTTHLQVILAEGEAKATEEKPKESKPKESKKEAKPKETKTTETKKPETKPKESKPPATKPPVTKPKETKQPETKQKEAKPEEAKPKQNKPEEKTKEAIKEVKNGN